MYLMVVTRLETCGVLRPLRDTLQVERTGRKSDVYSDPAASYHSVETRYLGKYTFLTDKCWRVCKLHVNPANAHKFDKSRCCQKHLVA